MGGSDFRRDAAVTIATLFGAGRAEGPALASAIHPGVDGGKAARRSATHCGPEPVATAAAATTGLNIQASSGRFMAGWA